METVQWQKSDSFHLPAIRNKSLLEFLLSLPKLHPLSLIHSQSSFFLTCFLFIVSVEELYLSCNQLSGPPPDLPPHTSVKCLHLNDNKLAQWADYEAVGCVFPNLEVLVARCNPLNSVTTTTEGCGERPLFSHLTSLNLSGSAISNPGDFFSVIRGFSALCNLRLQDIPLLEMWPSDLHRSFMVACSPSISCLNGSLVSEEERDRAERALVRFYTEEEAAPAWLQRHYKELLEKHGVPQRLAVVDLAPPTHVALHVRWRAEGKLVPMDVPVDCRPLEIARLIADKLGLGNRSAPKLRLLLIDVAAVAMEQYGISELRYDKPLYSYHARDGDELLVEWR